jgi:hypothetical protein
MERPPCRKLLMRPGPSPFESHDDPIDLAAGLDCLGPPAMQQCQQRLPIGALLLQWAAFDARHKARDEPALETQLDIFSRQGLTPLDRDRFGGDEL